MMPCFRILALPAIAMAANAQRAPQPHMFNTAPAPSSLVLLLAGLIVLIGWNWRRSRVRRETSRD
jgi:hypothetical protein